MTARSHATTPQLRTWLRLNSGRAAPLALFLSALLAYATTLTQVHTFDALSYVTSVERKPWTAVFHPHHLAYGPLGALALAVGKALGYGGGAALPMQLVNALAGALGMALFFAIARRVTGRADVALVVALLLGGAYAYWYYAVEIEVYTVATLFLLICLDRLIRLLDRPSRRGMVLLGLAQGGAVLFHQTNVLFCAPLLVALLMYFFDKTGFQSATSPHARPSPPAPLPLRRERGAAFPPLLPQRETSAAQRAGWCRRSGGGEGQSRWPGSARAIARLVLPYGAALVLTVGLPYLFVGVVVSGFRSWGDFETWVTEYARTGWWGGPITAQKWADLGAGLTDTLAQPGGALLWLLLLGLVVLHLRRLARPRALVGALVAWLVVYGAFFLWWEPDNIEFWIASLPPALLLLALALRGERRWGPGLWIALAVAVTAIAVNHDAIARRGDPATDLQRVIARELGARSQPADLLLVPDGLIELYLPYYEHHDNFLSLNQALFDAGADWGRACGAVRSRVETALHAGATALVSDEVLHPPALLLGRFKLSQGDVDACFAPYQRALQPIALGAGLPAYWRFPTGQEHAEQGGWRFERFTEGWKAENVGEERVEDGWRFVPASDPALTSPLMQLDAGRYQAIEVRMANGTKARDAQLFFAGLDGRMGEDRSVRWTLEPTADAVTYRITLAGQPGWQGTITRLRLDPVGVGDGGEVRVEWVRLVPG